MSSNSNFAGDALICGSKPWSYIQLCAVVSLAFILCFSPPHSFGKKDVDEEAKTGTDRARSAEGAF